MFTAQNLKALWEELRNFESENFGLKYGKDFGDVAAILRQSEEFMQRGGFALLMAGLEMSSLAAKMRNGSEMEKQEVTKGVIDKPNVIHSTLAEVFYVGYVMGQRSQIAGVLDKIAER